MPPRRTLAEVEAEVSARLAALLAARQAAAPLPGPPLPVALPPHAAVPLPPLQLPRSPARRSASGQLAASPLRRSLSKQLSGSLNPGVLDALGTALARASLQLAPSAPSAPPAPSGASRQASTDPQRALLLDPSVATIGGFVDASGGCGSGCATPPRAGSSAAAVAAAAEAALASVVVPLSPFTSKALELVRASQKAEGQAAPEAALGAGSEEVQALRRLLKRTIAAQKPAAAKPASKALPLRPARGSPSPVKRAAAPARASSSVMRASAEAALAKLLAHSSATVKSSAQPKSGATAEPISAAPPEPAAPAVAAPAKEQQQPQGKGRSASTGRATPKHGSGSSKGGRTPAAKEALPGTPPEAPAAAAARKKAAAAAGQQTAQRQARLQKLYVDLMHLDLEGM